MSVALIPLPVSGLSSNRFDPEGPSRSKSFWEMKFSDGLVTFSISVRKSSTNPLRKSSMNWAADDRLSPTKGSGTPSTSPSRMSCSPARNTSMPSTARSRLSTRLKSLGLMSNRPSGTSINSPPGRVPTSSMQSPGQAPIIIATLAPAAGPPEPAGVRCLGNIRPGR